MASRVLRNSAMRFLLIPFLMLPCSGFAAIVTSGNFSTGSPAPTISINAPFVLPVTNDTMAAFLVFKNWVPSPDTAETRVAAISGTLSYRVDDGPVMTVDILSAGDNAVLQMGDLTGRDGYLRFDLDVLAGDLLTILPGTITFATDAGFRTPPADFNGEVFLADAGGLKISEVAAVPEIHAGLVIPGALAMLALFWKRR